MTLTKPTAIIFDWDNTLVDTWPIIHAALVVAFESFGMEPWSLDAVKTHVKRSMRDAFPDVFGDDWQRAADIYQKAYRATALDQLTPLNGAEATLNHFTEAGIPLFVVSNKKGDNLRAELTHLGWERYFTNAVGSGDANEDKPSPEPVLHAIRPHGFEAAAGMWFIGDSDIDLECAQNAGCEAILYGAHAATLDGYEADSLNGFAFVRHVQGHGGLQALIA